MIALVVFLFVALVVASGSALSSAANAREAWAENTRLRGVLADWQARRFAEQEARRIAGRVDALVEQLQGAGVHLEQAEEPAGRVIPFRRATTH